MYDGKFGIAEARKEISPQFDIVYFVHVVRALTPRIDLSTI